MRTSKVSFLLLFVLLGAFGLGCGAPQLGGSSIRYLNMSGYRVKWTSIASSYGCFRSEDSAKQGWWSPGQGGTLYFCTIGNAAPSWYWGYGYGGGAEVSVTLEAYDSYGRLAGAHGETYQIGHYAFAKVFIVKNSTFSTGTGWDP